MLGRGLALVCCVLALGAAPAFAQGAGEVELRQTQTQPRMTSALRGLNDPLAAYQRGIDALFEGDYQTAVDAMRIYVNANPQEPGGLLAFGVALVGNGQDEAAIDPLQRVIRAANPPISAHVHLGIAYARLGQTDNARAQRNALARRLRQCGADCDQFDRDRISRAIDVLDQAIDAPSAAAPAVRI